MSLVGTSSESGRKLLDQERYISRGRGLEVCCVQRNSKLGRWIGTLLV